MTTLLQGKHVVITGAARGLGFDFACAALNAGAKVLVVDILGELLQKKAEKLQNQGFPVNYITADLTNIESIRQVSIWVENHWDAVDGLINCAALATGVGGVNMMEYDPELWDRVMNVNVKGTWLMTQAMVPFLKKSAAGKIVNIASDTALWGLQD